MPALPPRLEPGDTIRVVAPARSLAMIGEDVRRVAEATLGDLGLEVTYGEHVEESDRFVSTTAEHRVADLHEAFRDPEVAGILTVIGGFNSNQLLSLLDFGLIASNPKVLCGYSDITALQNAILARAGLVTYSGPHYSTFGMQRGNDYTVEGFRRAVFQDDAYEVEPSERWSDDRWFEDQDDRTFHPNPGPRVLRAGAAEGPVVGGNLCTLNLLQGTGFLPDLEGTILFVEDDLLSNAVTFDRDLQSLLHQPGAQGIHGLAIGRFQEASEVAPEDLDAIVASKREVPEGIPIVADLDFGHTSPQFTFPVGGRARLEAKDGEAKLTILEH